MASSRVMPWPRDNRGRIPGTTAWVPEISRGAALGFKAGGFGWQRGGAKACLAPPPIDLPALAVASRRSVSR